VQIGKHNTINIGIGSANREFRFRPGTSDEGVISQILTNSHYDLKRLRRDAELRGFYERETSLRKAALIIDAGANIGASPVFFASTFPKARVVAIEPEKDNFELLSANTQGLSVECIHGAVACMPGLADLIDPGEGSWGFRTSNLVDGKPTNQTIQCITINEIYEAHTHGYFPFIVKIDIEGGEHNLFSEATEWVARTPLIIIELHDWLLLRKASSRPFLRCISSHDRDFVHVGENIFSIDNNLMDGSAVC
jgi:FkbM family methyltransferase